MLFETPSRSDVTLLSSYNPKDEHLYSLLVDSTYFDIPHRAPRWATHAGSDYHGTWLPQVVRWALSRYTSQGDRILSNFVGRGTDAIECLLLKRRCLGVDINTTAVPLAQRNSCFLIPKELGISAVYRPLILLRDSRDLKGPWFQDESFDHVLSHPPYKDCISYSTNIEGDLSRFPDATLFQTELSKSVMESKRVLKMYKRVTLGIGDNRKECYIIPVSFQTIRTYLNAGFEIEELIVRRQRYTRMSSVGSYLSIQYNFLMCIHEFLVVFRKVPRAPVFTLFDELVDDVPYESIVRHVPHCSMDRTKTVTGTIWNFDGNDSFSWIQVALAMIVLRFGTNDTVWREVSIPQLLKSVLKDAVYHESCTEGHHSLSDLDKYEFMEYTSKVWGMPKLIHSSSLSLIVCPHLDIPVTAILKNDDWIHGYRAFIVSQAKHAIDQLAAGSSLVIGVKDVRVLKPIDTHLNKLKDLTDRFNLLQLNEPPTRLETVFIPLGLLVFEDLSLISHFRLREYFIVLPNGHAVDQSMDPMEIKARLARDEQEYQWECKTEHLSASSARRLLPIVHAHYFLYIKQ